MLEVPSLDPLRFSDVLGIFAPLQALCHLPVAGMFWVQIPAGQVLERDRMAGITEPGSISVLVCSQMGVSRNGGPPKTDGL